MKRKVIAGILLAASAVFLIFGIVTLYWEQQAGKEYESLQSAVETTTADTESSETTQEAIKESTEEDSSTSASEVDVPIDFDQLAEVNPDIYAWITVEGTNIDYPVLQSTDDNTFYLTHGYDKIENDAGAIFTELYNSKTFNDPNTVLYGHDMKNGTMFRDLLKYKDSEYFEEHRDIVIWQPGRELDYKVFAAYPYDSRHILQSIDFDNKVAYQSYLDYIYDIRDMSAVIDQDTVVTTEDKIITLSTCNGARRDQRYLVQAVLVSDSDNATVDEKEN